MFIKKRKDIFFLGGIFICLTLIFRKAFTIGFFADDYFLLKVSRVHGLWGFLNLFNPHKSYFYRPIPANVFYFLIHTFRENIFIVHVIVFITFFVGLIFLFKSVFKASKNRLFSYIFLIIYSTSFTHVFQIYANTFSEVALFTFLSISFYAFLSNKKLLSILFFVLALLSKEIAMGFPIFIFLYSLTFQKGFKKIKTVVWDLLPYLIISFCFLFIYKEAIQSVSILENYTPHFQPRLIVNNMIWYLLWSLGFPSFLPDFLPSLFSLPLPAFWKFFESINFSLYFVLLLIYLATIFIITVLSSLKEKNYKNKLYYIAFCVFSFYLFILPVLPIVHKWMVRLMVPFIFIALLESAILFLSLTKNRSLKYLSVFAMAIYIIFNYFAVSVHEEASTYLLETKIFNNAKNYFSKNKKEILKHDSIYFKDLKKGLPKGWNGSEKLKLSFEDNYFLDYYFPGKKIKAVYQSDNQAMPKNAYVVDSSVLLK